MKRIGLLSALLLIVFMLLPLLFAQAETEDDFELPDLVFSRDRTAVPTSEPESDDFDWGDVPELSFDNTQVQSTFSSNNGPVLREDELTDEEIKDTYYDPYVLNNKSLKRSDIRVIEFVDHLDSVGNDAWDVSMAENGSVWAWTEDEADGKRLIIAGDGGVTAPRDCSYFFARYENLGRILFNNCFFTGETRNMQHMFDRCKSLDHLDVSSFDTRNVLDFSYMFTKCTSLTELDIQSFDTSTADNMQGMFSYCSSLPHIDVTGFNTGNVKSTRGMFMNCECLLSLDTSRFDTSRVMDMSYMFSGCSNLNHLDTKQFNTSNATNMRYMFRDCRSLERIDVSGFDTANVTDMSYLFSDCSSLTGIDVSRFNTGNVSNMNHMFNNCSALTSIDVRGFDTSKVEHMAYLFYGCANLKYLDVSLFDTGNVINMSHMFSKCSNLSGLEVGNFNTGKVESMNDMFNNCSSLESLDVSGFDTGHVTDMYRMFNRCKSLQSVNASGFNTSKVKNTSKMFSNCTGLKQVDISDNFILLNREDLNTENMFASCNAKLVRDGQVLTASDWMRQAIIERDMAKGSTGASVKWLQRILIKLGFLSGQADGIWGDETEEGLKRFQSASGIVETGCADEETIEALCNSDTTL